MAIVALTLGTLLGVAVTLWRVSTGADPMWGAVSAADASYHRAISSGRPKVEVVGEDSYEFDAMERNATGTHTFVLKNVGGAALALQEGTTSCTCTLSNLSKSELLPGETAEVTLEWKPRSYDVEFQQTATVKTNDPNRPEVALTVSGRIVHTVMPMPTNVDFSGISGHEPISRQVGVYCYRAGEFRIDAVKFADEKLAEHLSVRIEEMPPSALEAEVGAKSGVVLTITAKPGLPQGPINQTILLTTNLESFPVVDIPVRGNVIGEISFFGNAKFDGELNVVSLGRVKRDVGASVKLYVMAKGPHRQDVEFSVGDVTPDFLAVQIGQPREINDGAVISREIAIEVPGGSPFVDHLGQELESLGKVTIRTTHPNAPELPLYVRFSVDP